MKIEEARALVLGSLQGIKVLSEEKVAAFRQDPAKDIELASLGIDSVAVMDFCLLLEQGIGREIEITELIDNSTVNKLAAHFAKP